MNQNTLNHIEYCFRKAKIYGRPSHTTIIKYASSIKRFFSIVDKDIEELQMDDFEFFVDVSVDGGAGNARIANVLSAMRWLIKKLQEYGRISSIIDVDKIISPPINKKETIYLTEEEIEIFLRTIDEDTSKGLDIRKYRFMALVIFLLGTGARLGEALSVKIKDIDRENKEIKIIGKGEKPRTLFLLDEKILKCVDEYLAMRKDDCEFLFVSLNGRSFWKQTDIGRTFRRYKRLSGIKKHFTLHTLRHTEATMLLLKGVPINIVQTILGHSDPETTMRYYVAPVSNEVIKKTLKREHFNFIPETKNLITPPLLSQSADSKKTSEK